MIGMNHSFPSNQSDSDQFGIEREIQSRAYELYEQRGKKDGHELDDWLKAEAEVLQVRVKHFIHEMLLGCRPTAMEKCTNVIRAERTDSGAT